MKADKCKKFKMFNEVVLDLTLCAADVTGTLNPGCNSVNTTAFDDIFSGSVFDEDQKAKLLYGYNKCADDAHAYMEENGDTLWNVWQETQTA